MTPDELAALRERHQPNAGGMCQSWRCPVSQWPCPIARLLAHIDAQQAELDGWRRYEEDALYTVRQLRGMLPR